MKYDFTAAMAELLARDDCPLKGWVGLIYPPGHPRPETLIKLILGNPEVESVSDVTSAADLLKGRYFHFNTVIATGIYNDPDDGFRKELRSSMLMCMAKGANLYMTVRMNFRNPAAPKSRFFTGGELQSQFEGAFESVKIITLHNKWTQLVLGLGRKWDE